MLVETITNKKISGGGEDKREKFFRSFYKGRHKNFKLSNKEDKDE